MQDPKDIEKIFQESFNNFEVEAPAEIWANVSKQLPNAGATTTSSRSWLKPASYAAAVVGVSLSAYLLFNNNDQDLQDQPEANTTALVTTNANDLSESSNVEEESLSNSNTPAPSPKANSSSDITSKSEEPEEEFGDEIKIIDHTTDEPYDFEKAKNASNDISKEVEPTNVQATPTPIKEEVSLPVANIVASSENGEAPLVVRFNNDGNADSYDWDFGDGIEKSHLASPQREFKKAGTYKVRLTTKNKNGATATDFITVNVRAASNIIIPNIFTPNADGINDRFVIQSESIKGFEGSIIDPKNGKVIYQWSRPQEDAWDGKYPDGSNAPDGNYLYIIRYFNSYDEVKTQRGTVRLDRGR